MAFSVLISGENYRVANSYSITELAGSVSNSSLDVLVEAGQDVPPSLQDVQILNDGTPFFFGIIKSVQSPDFSSGYESKRYRLSVLSGESVFNNRLASEAFENKYTHEIVQSLFTNYISEEGFTLGQISTSEKIYENYNFQFLCSIS